jgi:hypothetical protein
LSATVRIIDGNSVLPADITAALSVHAEDCAILAHVDGWDEHRWHAADASRSAWERQGSLIWCLGPNGADAMGRFAPNIRSYVGTYHVIAPDEIGMTEEEVRNRLEELRTEYGRTDQDVIKRAEEGALPPGAHFVEWLILLNRGDLV